jgi:histone deacetylase HOS3
VTPSRLLMRTDRSVQIQTVCQAIDRVCDSLVPIKMEPSTPPPHVHANGIRVTPPMDNGYFDPASAPSRGFSKAFCAIRPPGHHCGEDLPSGCAGSSVHVE